MPIFCMTLMEAMFWGWAVAKMRWMGKFLNAYESMAWPNSVARPWPQYCILNIQGDVCM